MPGDRGFKDLRISGNPGTEDLRTYGFLGLRTSGFKEFLNELILDLRISGFR